MAFAVEGHTHCLSLLDYSSAGKAICLFAVNNALLILG